MCWQDTKPTGPPYPVAAGDQPNDAPLAALRGERPRVPPSGADARA